MDKTTEDRIIKEAADKYPQGGLYFSQSDHNRSVNLRKGYIAGAMAENNRIQPIINDIEMIRAAVSALIRPAFWNQEIDNEQRELIKIRNTIDNTLEQWKGTGKEGLPTRCFNVDEVQSMLIDFALTYHKNNNKDIANDAAEYIHDILTNPPK